MNLLSDVVLGNIVDPLESQESQCELNEELLNKYDRDNLFFSITNKMSKYEIKYYVDTISLDEKDYWYNVLSELIKVYKLNPIKTFITSDFVNDRSNMEEVVKLLVFVKYNVQEYILRKKIRRDMTIDEMFEFAKAHSNSKFFTFSMEYTDRESFTGFMSTIFKEFNKMEEEKI